MGFFFKYFQNEDVNFADHAYYIAFAGVVGATLRHRIDLGVTDKLDFVFDRQMAYFERARASFDKFWKEIPEIAGCLAGTPRWADDEDVLPLQAAEWLVWQVRKHYHLLDDRAADPSQDLFIQPQTAGKLKVVIDEWNDDFLKDAYVKLNTEMLAEVEKNRMISGSVRREVKELIRYRLRKVGA